jgi:alkylation response protein AidB-like acyl-CoA dehydrogenase
VAYAVAMMEVAQGCASTAVIMAVNNLVAETIVRFGTEEQKQRYVPEITSGRFAAASFGLSSPTPAPTRGLCRPPPGRTATITSSTAASSGSRRATRPV